MRVEQRKVDVVTIAGTRPEIIKLSELVQLLGSSQHYNQLLLYTGQHYSDNMKSVFFDELRIKPDYDLRCDTSDVGMLKESMVKFLSKMKPPMFLSTATPTQPLPVRLPPRRSARQLCISRQAYAAL